MNSWVDKRPNCARYDYKTNEDNAGDFFNQGAGKDLLNKIQKPKPIGPHALTVMIQKSRNLELIILDITEAMREITNGRRYFTMSKTLSNCI